MATPSAAPPTEHDLLCGVNGIVDLCPLDPCAWALTAVEWAAPTAVRTALSPSGIPGCLSSRYDGNSPKCSLVGLREDGSRWAVLCPGSAVIVDGPAAGVSKTHASRVSVDVALRQPPRSTDEVNKDEERKREGRRRSTVLGGSVNDGGSISAAAGSGGPRRARSRGLKLTTAPKLQASESAAVPVGPVEVDTGRLGIDVPPYVPPPAPPPPMPTHGASLREHKDRGDGTAASSGRVSWGAAAAAAAAASVAQAKKAVVDAEVGGVAAFVNELLVFAGPLKDFCHRLEAMVSLTPEHFTLLFGDTQAGLTYVASSSPRHIPTVHPLVYSVSPHVAQIRQPSHSQRVEFNAHGIHFQPWRDEIGGGRDDPSLWQRGDFVSMEAVPRAVVRLGWHVRPAGDASDDAHARCAAQPTHELVAEEWLLDATRTPITSSVVTVPVRL